MSSPSTHFNFSRYPMGELSGFDLGDIEILVGTESYRSSGHTPDQSMMIYGSIAYLLSGVCDLVQTKQKAFEFTGIDSSFSIRFWRKEERVTLSGGERSLGTIYVVELITALHTGVHAFLGDPAHRLPEHDPMYEDVERATARLDSLRHRQGMT